MKKLVMLGTAVVIANNAMAFMPPPPPVDANGLPIIHYGVHVMSDDNIPRLKISDAEQRKEIILESKIKQLGYTECTNCTDIKYYWENIIAQSYEVKDIVRPDFKDLKLSFPYNGIPFITKKDVLLNIGTSSVVGDEFTGIMQIFRAGKLGTCSFTIEDNKHMATYLAVDEVNYNVNGKVTEDMIVSGHPKFGFIYDLNWYDEKFNYNLSCVDYKFNDIVKANITNYAKRIDSALHMVS